VSIAPGAGSMPIGDSVAAPAPSRGRRSSAARACSRRSPADEPALGVLAEPVDVEDGGRALDRLPHLQPMPSSRPCCSRRRGASPSDRGARRRPPRSAPPSSPKRPRRRRTRRGSSRKACSTRGAVRARRPPNTSAEMGTPCGSSNLGEIDGHCAAGAVKREFGCAAFSLEPRCHGARGQSVSRSAPGRRSPPTRGSRPRSPPRW